MGKRRLSKSDIKELNTRISFVELSKKDDVDLVEDEEKVYFVNGEAWIVDRDGLVFPHLKLLLSRPEILKKATVDMGAVKFVTNGADVMRPGIVAFDLSISKDELVVLDEETHHKALAVCLSLIEGSDFEGMDSGKALQTIHFVGDKLWNRTT